MRGKASHTISLLCVLFLLVTSITAATEKVIYVDDNAIGANDGTNWADAYNYLQDGLADANTAEKPVEIRIAQGIYSPDKGVGIKLGDSHAEFQLINGVTVRGGFAGIGAIEPDARNIEAYKTILSGDLAGDDAEVDNLDNLSGDPTRAENSYSVVSGNDTDETAMLDGVTITAGSKCMSIWYGEPDLLNCTLTNSRQGIFSLNSSQTLTNCTFRGLGSSTISQNQGSLELINCLFTGNAGDIHSGGSSELILHNCTFADNLIRSSGVINCTSSENLRMYNCVFRNNVSRSSVAGVNASINEELIVDNCTFTGNIGMSIDHHSTRGRMVISNCLFAGNTEGFFTSGINSWGRYVTVKNCTFSGNTSVHPGSALNLINGGKVSNCIFWGNNQPAISGREQELYLRYCNVQGGWPGEENIDVDPCFVSPGYWEMNGTSEDTADDFWVDGNYHLQSQAGRWNQESQTWVQDDVTSPCIDAGDPNSSIGIEPFPNGGRLNMGAYGASEKASKSYFGEPVCETIIAGDINGDCVVDFEDLMILISHWMMRPEDLVNKPPTVRLIEPRDGDRIAWPGPTTFIAEASDPDGQVNRIKFYMEYRTDNYTRGKNSEDSDGSDGWECEFTWPGNAEFGEWTVFAEATDNKGLVGVSPEITIILYRP